MTFIPSPLRLREYCRTGSGENVMPEAREKDWPMLSPGPYATIAVMSSRQLGISALGLYKNGPTNHRINMKEGLRGPFPL